MGTSRDDDEKDVLLKKGKGIGSQQGPFINPVT